jgi:predicted metal-dependent enzyme (double-stranded beta helix superfamily)
MGSVEPATDLERFFDTAERLVADHGPTPEAFARVGDLLRILAADRTLIEHSTLDALHQSSAQATILGHGAKGSTLMLGRFSAEAPTPVHNHNSWGVLCVIRGRDRHIRWARQDDGSQQGKAQLRIVETRELDPGDVTWFPDVPGDIHSQQGIGEAAWELVYFGRDPMALPRLYFDPESGRVEERAAI